MLDVIWRPRASEALSHFISFISEHNAPAARNLRLRILESVEPARIYPEIGRIGRARGTREIIAHPNYLVIYRTLPGAIEVLDVVHARQQYP